MLKQLNIRDFAIIDEIELTFNKGMTVLTGETGAGKSILIDALGQVLGDRADTGMIRHERDRAEITAIFSFHGNEQVAAILEEQAITPDDNELLIRRVITKQGASRVFINNTPVTVQLLRQIGENLIDIHGQHAHQSLSKHEIQRQLLDDFGDHPGTLTEVAEIYQRWQDARSQLDALSNNSDQTATMSLLRYQVDELDSLTLGAGEYEQLDEEHRKLANTNRLLETAQHALTIFREGDETIFSSISGIINDLRELRRYDESLGNIIQTLDDAAIQINEASDELRVYIDNLQVDPDQLQVVENRISQLHDMARKHQVQPQQLASHLNGLKNQLNEMENNRELIEELQIQRSRAMEDYSVAAEKLHQTRKKAAQEMSAAISTKLKQLGMPNGQFMIAVESRDGQDPKPYGKDQIDFLVNTNPGQDLQPLRKVASGGELSRISLAIQTCSHRNNGNTSLVFDEVDAGIGGGVAEIVGNLLHQLAQTHQVFCVTHLAQVASQGDHHLQVNKSSTKTSTETKVTELNPDERIEEIARMLGGIQITEQSREHAKEMLN